MKNNKGLTLMELLIVIIILTVLVGLFFLRHRNLVQKEKLVKTFSLLKIVAEAKRQQMIKAPEVIVSGQITNGHNSTTYCPNVAATRGPGYLIACNYLQPEQWVADYHLIYTCHQGQGGGCCSGSPAGTIACTIFYPDPDTTAARWNYYITKAGDCTAGSGAPPCLEF